jgi:lipoprotein-anchoring transpeptidase ErfK/SrfK
MSQNPSLMQGLSNSGRAQNQNWSFNQSMPITGSTTQNAINSGQSFYTNSEQGNTPDNTPYTLRNLKKPINPFNIGLGMEAATGILGEFAGMYDRGRQNEYMTRMLQQRPQGYDNNRSEPVREGYSMMELGGNPFMEKGGLFANYWAKRRRGETAGTRKPNESSASKAEWERSAKTAKKYQDGGLTFGQAFAKNRKDGKSEFSWNGKMYNTQLAEETTVPKNNKTVTNSGSGTKVVPNENINPNGYSRTRPSETFDKSVKLFNKIGSVVGYNSDNLESGVVVDKRQNQAHVLQNGKVVKSFPVLTGKNPEGASNNFPFSEVNDDKLKVTPNGNFLLRPNNNIYGAKGFNVENINEFDKKYFPTKGVAMHTTYDPAKRNKFYNMSPEQRYQSYGCINCRPEDINFLTNQFPKGDTLMVLDPLKNKKDAQFLKNLKRK